VPVAVALIVLLAARADAQTARLGGTVSDKDGHALPWTSITATCGDATATAVTDISGRFDFDAVPIGPCRLIVVTPSAEVIVQHVMVPVSGTAASVEVPSRDQPKPSSSDGLAARGETPPAFGAPSAAAALGTPFGRRCIPADCVAPPSNIPDILSRRALSAGRLAALDATADFHHGLLAATLLAVDNLPMNAESMNRIRLSDQWWMGGAFQADTVRPLAGFGPTWLATAGMTYITAGMQVTTSASARRGYDLPLFMVQPIGSNELLRSDGMSIVSGSRSAVIWDTELRVRRRLKTSRAGQVDFVVEGLNLLNLNRFADRPPISPTLTSRTLRCGLVFTF
jgi:hypothetical protein